MVEQLNLGEAPYPFVKGSDTSEAAADSFGEEDRGQDRWKVLRAVDVVTGSTCDEIEAFTGLKHQTASARVNDLVKAGLLVDSGERRPTRSNRPARVLKLTPRGLSLICFE